MHEVINKIHTVLLLVLISQLVYAQKDSVDAYKYNLIELSGLTVNSVSKAPQELGKVPATVHIITSEEISEKGHLTLDEALSDLPGFQFRNIMGFNSYVFQRGIPSQNNLILLLIDGIQINELNSGGFYSGGQYNLENVDRIEVVYGPASVTYGTNAISGIINIITKNSQGVSSSILSGNFDTYNANLNYGFASNKFGIRVSGMYKTSEKASLSGYEGDNNWTPQMENFEDDYSLDAKVWYKDFILGVNFLNKQSSTTTNYPSIGTIYQEQGSLWNIMFANIYLKHQYNFGDNITLSSKAYYRNATVSDNTISRVVDTAQIGYFRPNQLFGLESVLNYSIKNKLKFIFGALLETEQIAEGFSVTYSNSPKQAPPTPPKPIMLQNSLLSLFLESNFEIVRNLFVVGGFRFDNSSFYDQVFTPRLSLIFNHRKINTKLLYAEAFRAPKPWDYTDGLGNPDLLPEHMKSIELSNTMYFSDFFVYLTIYKNILDEAIVKEVIGADDNYSWVNQGSFETNGAEIGIQYSIKRLKLFANYTYNFTYDENKELIPEISKHSVNTGITYRFSNNFRFNMGANYFGKRKNPQTITATNKDFIDPAIVLNGSLSFVNFQNLDIQLTIRNILNAEYYHTSNRLVERYRQPQRTIRVKLTYNFINK